MEGRAVTERHHAFLSFRRLATRSSRRALARGLVLVVSAGLLGESLYGAVALGLPGNVVAESLAADIVGEEQLVPELVEIPAGTFLMGSAIGSEEQPAHPVSISEPFYIGRTEVTFREWDACVADNGCGGYSPDDQGWGRGTRPVINVSWFDAQAYIGWLSGKIGRNCGLPSEAAWEYAARAGTTTQYGLPAPQGSDDIAGKGIANCVGCGSEWDDRQTAPVGSFPANTWGLDDMHGNVWEWVWDCMHPDYAGAPDNGQAWGSENGGDCEGRILRGGSWADDQGGVRSAVRRVNFLSGRDAGTGFRVVCSNR